MHNLTEFESVAGGRSRQLTRVLKLGISAVFVAIVTTGRALLRLAGKVPPATCIILYYHSIPLEQRDAFARQLEIVARLTTPVNIEDLPTFLPGVRYSALTFDDAFEDAVENAVPELVKRKVPAVIFVTTDVLGQPAAWWPPSAPERSRRIATAEQLHQLPSQWIGIGAHAKTHPRLSSLNEADARREIAEPRHTLEAMLGRKVDFFSFPYGDFNEQAVQLCREAGYTKVFTTQNRNAFHDREEFLVGRVCAEPTDWKLEFRLKLLGGYLWMPRAVVLKRKLLALPVVSRLRSRLA